MPSIEGSLMHRSSRARGAHARSRRRPRFWAAALTAGLAGVALAALTGIAIAKATTVGVANNVKVGTKTETIVVGAKGATVYTLGPEIVGRTSHIFCKKANRCFTFWPPVTVPSAHSKLTAAKGVTGKLGILHRDGVFQVTLAGRPLYYFMPDMGKKGLTQGDGIPNLFGGGGKWHVVKASTAAHAPTHTTTTTTTSTNPYGY
jgi:predicted lipoprotein with Yx(FWY)xxD motif